MTTPDQHYTQGIARRVELRADAGRLLRVLVERTDGVQVEREVIWEGSRVAGIDLQVIHAGSPTDYVQKIYYDAHGNGFMVRYVKLEDGRFTIDGDAVTTEVVEISGRDGPKIYVGDDMLMPDNVGISDRLVGEPE